MRTALTGFVAGPCAPIAQSSFRGAAICNAPATRASIQHAPARIHMRSDRNLALKKEKVESVREDLAKAEFIFQVPLPGMTVAQVSELKNSLPEGSSCRTVKNTLMKRAVEGTDWVVLGDLCQESTVWFFVKEDIKGTVQAYTKFAKANQREDVLGGCMDKILYDSAGVKTVAELPTKDELYRQIAVLLKALPTKVARGVKAVPTKLGRAVKLAIADENSSDAPAEA